MPVFLSHAVMCTNKSISQSINVTSVAMRFTEEFMPAIHQKSLGLIVVVDPVMYTHLWTSCALLRVVLPP
jgi:hypothetical protein